MSTDWRDHETRDVPFNGLLASGSGVAAGGGYSVPGGPWNVAAYRSTAIRVDGNGTLATVEVTWVGDVGGPSIPSKETKVATIDPCTLFFQNQGHTITSILITAGAGTSYEVLESNQLPLAKAAAAAGAIDFLFVEAIPVGGQTVPTATDTEVAFTNGPFTDDPTLWSYLLDGSGHIVEVNLLQSGAYLVLFGVVWDLSAGGFARSMGLTVQANNFAPPWHAPDPNFPASTDYWDHNTAGWDTSSVEQMPSLLATFLPVDPSGAVVSVNVRQTSGVNKLVTAGYLKIIRWAL